MESGFFLFGAVELDSSVLLVDGDSVLGEDAAADVPNRKHVMHFDEGDVDGHSADLDGVFDFYSKDVEFVKQRSCVAQDLWLAIDFLNELAKPQPKSLTYCEVNYA